MSIEYYLSVHKKENINFNIHLKNISKDEEFNKS